MARANSVELLSLKVYRKMCNRLEIPQLRTVWSQLGNVQLTFKDLFLSSRGVKATCCALMYEPNTENLDLSGNHIGKKECDYVVSILEQTTSICVLDLSNNELSGISIQKLASCLVKNATIVSLTLSGNKLTDGDAEAVALIIAQNRSITRLYASHNEFREEGGKVIGSAIGMYNHGHNSMARSEVVSTTGVFEQFSNGSTPYKLPIPILNSY
ncbi:leucine-rich repeat-containing protein 74B-like [Gigantopelta aegis]|uniref:leucine-rich repeat-containing protein 74B-like n=1 Tax=Gigantopelta aegis TaxID=1735272 RepID=UPI001B88D0A4|nr:leucine-rich repeat-containing protein 74B-like [Gigantopelta aegis]